ncbi:MAG: flippase-like domain-containing protein [Gaiella sp.]|nr:flippase-like domain-containing protein [Gaiella sp.]
MNLLASIVDAVAAASDRFGSLDGRYLLPALTLQLLTLVFRALAWRGVIVAAYPGRRIPVVSIGAAYAAGVAMNAFTPARGGELAKVLIARTRIPASTVPTLAASLTVVLAADALIGGALVCTLWGMGVLPALPPPPGLVAVEVAVGAVFAVGVGIAIAYRLRPDAVRRLAGRAAQGIQIVRQPGRYLCTVLPFQVAAWGCRIGVVFLVLAAFGIPASLATAALVVVLNGASTLVPVPGGAGTQQVLATFALQGAVSAATAVSFSLGMQVGVTAVNTTVGLVALMLLFRTMRPVGAVRSARALVARRELS